MFAWRFQVLDARIETDGERTFTLLFAFLLPEELKFEPTRLDESVRGVSPHFLLLFFSLLLFFFVFFLSISAFCSQTCQEKVSRLCNKETEAAATVGGLIKGV